MKQFKNDNSDPGQSYEVVVNSQTYIIHSGNTRPCQFSLVKIATMSAITDSIGQGWDGTRDLKYFSKKNNSKRQQKQQLRHISLNSHTLCYQQ
jgi:hypothetical protein